MNIAESMTDLVGKTPLVRLSRISHTNMLAKIESLNPGGSVKDRTGLSMIKAAEISGQLTPGMTIIEPTSGNTGIALAWISAIKRYKLILTMPEEMTQERRMLLASLGATVILTDADLGMEGAIAKAKSLATRLGNTFIPMQFENEANPEIHMQTTAREIWNDTEGTVDIFVSGVGTGGTVTGVGRFLKKKKPSVQIIAVEPQESPVLSGGKPGTHMIQGIGASFVPKVLDRTVIDDIVQVSDAEAFLMTKKLFRYEGIICGISSGAAVHAAIKVSSRPENRSKPVVVILPDTGERYLSTTLFQD